MNKLRFIISNKVDDSTLYTSPALADGYEINNLKSLSRSTKIVTNAFGKGSYLFQAGQGGDNPVGIYVSPNGSNLYIVDTNIVYQYSLTNGDLLSAVYDNKNKSVSTETSLAVGVFFSTDGTKMYITRLSAYIYYYDLSIAWDVSTAIYVGSKDLNLIAQQGISWNIWFSADGLELYTPSWSPSSEVNRWTLGTAWDTSTASFTQTLDTSTNVDSPSSVSFHSDGSTMYVSDLATQIVHQYNLSAAWDLSTASYSNKSVDISTQDIAPRSFFIAKDNNLKFYMLGGNSDTAYQYELTTDKDISTLIYNTNNQTILMQIGNPSTISSIVFGRHKFPKDTVINIYFYSNIDYTGELYSSGDLIINTEQSGGSFTAWGDFLWGEVGVTWGEDLKGGEFISAYNYVHWIPTPITNILSTKIVISNIISDEIEFSRLIMGEFIEPTYNISYGHTLQWAESTKQFRSSSGATLRSTVNFPNRRLEFSLNTIVESDRNIIQDGMRNVGLRKDFFVSLFPEDTDQNKLIDYSGIVKLVKTPTTSEFMPSYYKSKYIMEEV
jgi:sugar lactone lactonase YvrE